MAVRRALGIMLAVAAWLFGMSVSHILVLGLCLLICIFVVAPTVFHYSATIQRHMVFLPWVKWPKNIDFDKPQDEGMNGTLNFYLEVEPKVQVGVWHILPQSMIGESEGKERDWYEKSLSGGKPVIIYLHGNTGSRGRDHRIETYQKIRALDYHIVAFDYRGYADSSPSIPTKTGVVTDGAVVYEYVRSKAGSSPVFFWGHSLGAAVSTQLVSDLTFKNEAPIGLILESPFNNLYDEIKFHPTSYLWRKMPWFDWFFTSNLEKYDVGFVSDKVIVNIEIPIVILHAEDDLVIPFELGETLYKAALSGRPSSAKPVQFVPFPSEKGYGHIHIHTAPELPDIIRKFVDDCISDNWK